MGRLFLNSKLHYNDCWTPYDHRKTTMTGIDGEGEDKKLWQTYVYWARKDIKDGPDVELAAEEAIADKPSERVDHFLAEAIQSILFSALMLEYRLKRVLTYMGVPLSGKESLRRCLGLIWEKLPNIDRKDGKGKCRQPKEWQNSEPHLRALNEFRNKVAHANYNKLLHLFQGKDPVDVARLYYNAVVDAMIMLNLCIGYETKPLNEVEKYFRPLRIIMKTRHD